MAPAEERPRYPDILGFREFLQEVYRGVLAHHPPAYRTAQNEWQGGGKRGWAKPTSLAGPAVKSQGM